MQSINVTGDEIEFGIKMRRYSINVLGLARIASRKEEFESALKEMEAIQRRVTYGIKINKTEAEVLVYRVRDNTCRAQIQKQEIYLSSVI